MIAFAAGVVAGALILAGSLFLWAAWWIDRNGGPFL
jgi:hypothetical protein